MGDPVLFLDVDGVLNSVDCWETLRGSRHKIDRTKVAMLNEVVSKTGCRIVMSSTWREGLPDVRRILRDYGLKAKFARPWRTRATAYGHDDPTVRMRGSEIADWLQDNGSPPYAIVDDDSDMLPSQEPFFVQTTFQAGLQRDHADRLIALLGSTPSPAAPFEGA